MVQTLVKEWELIEEVLVNNTSDLGDNQILEAKIEKIDNWKYFQEVEGQCIIFVRWVVANKNKSKDTVYKVRLVA